VAFDTFVQHSPTTATKLLQRAVNAAGRAIPIDGKMGIGTLTAINAINGKVLRGKLLQVREDYYKNRVQNDPSQQRFLAGWLNRLESIS
jgi:lysozyme family protein